MKTVYVLDRGKDFILPQELCWPVTSFGPSVADVDLYFQFIQDPVAADYLFFPLYLTPIVQKMGVPATTALLRSLLPDFAANERRFVFFNYEDISEPFGIESIIFQISLNRNHHDTNAIAYPYPMDDPLHEGSIKFNSVIYETSFVGFTGSHSVRPRIVAALSKRTDLQM